MILYRLADRLEHACGLGQLSGSRAIKPLLQQLQRNPAALDFPGPGCIVILDFATVGESNRDARRSSLNAWNNRLADLHRMRLARRSRDGRQWVYTPVAAQVLHG